MRLPRLRLKLWMLVVVVTVAGLLLGGEALRRRQAGYLRRAAFHAGMERTERQQAEMYQRIAAGSRESAGIARAMAAHMSDDPDAVLPDGTPVANLRRMELEGAGTDDRLAAQMESYARKHAESAASRSRLRRKCERAACYPFLLVAPDAPEPDPE